MKSKHWMPLCLLALSASTQAAEMNHWYIGVSGGAADFDLNVTDAERHLPFTNAAGDPLSQDTYRFNTDTSVYQIFDGYRFNRYIAAEIHYADMGTVNRKGDFTVTNGGPLNGILTSLTKFEASGAGLSVLGIWPVNDQIEIFGRAGVFAWRLHAPFTIDSNGSRLTAGDPGESGKDPFFGIGGVYKWEDFGVRLEYQRYTFERPFGATHDTDANVFNVGAFYSF